MKITLSTLIIIYSITVLGQTSQEHFQNGITKHKQQDYKGAIKEYTKSIKEDNTNSDAYYNRGTCELALKNFKEALVDFNKTIELKQISQKHITAKQLFLLAKISI